MVPVALLLEVRKRVVDSPQPVVVAYLAVFVQLSRFLTDLAHSHQITRAHFCRVFLMGREQISMDRLSQDLEQLLVSSLVVVESCGHIACSLFQFCGQCNYNLSAPFPRGKMLTMSLEPSQLIRFV